MHKPPRPQICVAPRPCETVRLDYLVKETADSIGWALKLKLSHNTIPDFSHELISIAHRWLLYETLSQSRTRTRRRRMWLSTLCGDEGDRRWT